MIIVEIIIISVMAVLGAILGFAQNGLYGRKDGIVDWIFAILSALFYGAAGAVAGVFACAGIELIVMAIS